MIPVERKKSNIKFIYEEEYLVMKPQSLAKWLKFIIIGGGFFGLIVYAFVIPEMGQEIAALDNGAFAYCYWPWLVFIWMTGIPCCIALFLTWKIATNIGLDKSFSLSNAKLLKWISNLAAGDAVFFLAGNIVFLFLNMNHPGVVLASVMVAFVGVAIAVVSAALSYLVKKAEILQDQSDWTI